MFRDVEKSARWFIDNRVGIEVSQIPGAGLGCVALDDIPSRTVIESSPVIICAPYTFAHLNEIHRVRHILSDYPFHWPDGNRAFALGWAGIYNHSSLNQNLQWIYKTEVEHGYNALCFVTRRDVSKGEELLVKYHPDSSKLWFVDEDAQDTRIPRSASATAMSPGMQLSGYVINQNKRRYAREERAPDDRETIGSWGLASDDEE